MIVVRWTVYTFRSLVLIQNEFDYFFTALFFLPPITVKVREADVWFILQETNAC